VLAFSCKKKECDNPDVVDGINLTELPPATMTGANTMGCLINGEVWLPLSKNILGDLVYDINFSVTSVDQGGVSVQAHRKYDDFYDRMSIGAEEAVDVGIFAIPSWINEYLDVNSNCGYFDLDSTYNNFIEITKLDHNEEIVSGLYQMRVVNDECDTLTITQGRFDLSP
jgi:hypothetical protein